MMRGVVTGGTATAIMANKELSKRMICGKTGTVNDFTDAWFLGYTPSYAAGVWIGFPGLKKTLGNKEAGGVAALPMWIHFMEPFLKDKPNDLFPKAPAPDRDILARRAETNRALLKAQGDDANGSVDENASKAKSAFDESKAPVHPVKPPAESDPTDRPVRPPSARTPGDMTAAPHRTPVPKTPPDTADKEKAKRGKNG
jgi:penicillin-binding protein 1A